MTEKPQRASGYRGEYLEQVKATCLYVATKLGDLLEDVVVVGGLVPSLLIRPEDLPKGEAAHVGTMDLDVGFALGLLEGGRYQALADRLRGAGFEQDTNEEGRLTRQRWQLRKPASATIDFLIPPFREGDRGGMLRHLEVDFAALITPGLHLAFEDRRKVNLAGRTLLGERAERSIWVCGPGAYVVLKALAFDGRGENKDAYDLYYVIRGFGSGIEDVAASLQPLTGDPDTKKAIEVLKRDFLDCEGPGPRRVAEFIQGGPDENLQADVAGFVRRLLDMCESNLS
jgi:hypothetical protein